MLQNIIIVKLCVSASTDKPVLRETKSGRSPVWY